MPEPAKKIGYYVGVLDLYYAIMTQEDTATAKPVYATPAVLGKNIKTKVTPKASETRLDASDVAVRHTSTIDSYILTITVDQVVSAVRAALLGRTVDANGVEIIKGMPNAPYVAVGFARTLDNGEKELWWLYKGKFSEMEMDGETKGQQIKYQTPTLTATFDRRTCDDQLMAVLDTGSEVVGAKEAAANWFSAVYETNKE